MTTSKKLITQFKNDKLRQDHLKLIEKTNDPMWKVRYQIQLELYDKFMGYDKLSEMEKEEYGKRS